MIVAVLNIAFFNTEAQRHSENIIRFKVYFIKSKKLFMSVQNRNFGKRRLGTIGT